MAAHIEEWSPLTPPIRCSNPVIRKFYFLSTVLKRQKRSDKRLGMTHLKSEYQFTIY